MKDKVAFFITLVVSFFYLSGIGIANQKQNTQPQECGKQRQNATVLQLNITRRLNSSYTSYVSALKEKQRELDKEWANEREFRQSLIESSLQVILPGAGKLIGRIADRYLITGASIEVYRIGVVTLNIYDNRVVQGVLMGTNQVLSKELSNKFHEALSSLSSSEDEVTAFIKHMEHSYHLYIDLIGEALPCLSEAEEQDLHSRLNPMILNSYEFEKQIDRQLAIFRWVAKAGSGFSTGCKFVGIDGQDGKPMMSIVCHKKIYQAGWKFDEHGTKRMALFDCFEGTDCRLDGWIPEEFQSLAIAKMRRKSGVSELPTF